MASVQVDEGEEVVLNEEQPPEQSRLSENDRFKVTNLRKERNCLWSNDKATNKK